MRRTATTSVNVIKLAVLGMSSVLLLAPTVSAEQHAGGAGQTLMATIKPVDTGQDRVADVTYGTAKFTQGSGKVDVLVQVSGVPLGGRETVESADGGPATVGFDARIVKGSDCATRGPRRDRAGGAAAAARAGQRLGDPDGLDRQGHAAADRGSAGRLQLADQQVGTRGLWRDRQQVAASSLIRGAERV